MPAFSQIAITHRTPKMQALRSALPTLRLSGQGLQAVGSARYAKTKGAAAVPKKSVSSTRDVVSLKKVAEDVSQSSGIVAKDCENIIKSVIEVVERTIADGGKVTFSGTGLANSSPYLTLQIALQT
jgi:hypothetical protein